MIKLGSLLTMHGVIWGGLGGFLFHVYWLIQEGHKERGRPMSLAKSARNHRLKLMALSVFVGIAAGLLVFIWFQNDLISGVIPIEKVAVVAVIAGMSGESVLGLFRKLGGL